MSEKKTQHSDLVVQSLNGLPPGVLDLPAERLCEVFEGPTLIRIEGEKRAPLFVSVLLHGNEHSGWAAMKKLMGTMRSKPRRPILLFVGNVPAARVNARMLPGQADYNRIWRGNAHSECAWAQQLLTEMRTEGLFAAVDIHNNTGRNPLYSCIPRLDEPFVHLAQLFSKHAVYFLHPPQTQTNAFGDFVPAITLECGLSGDKGGVARAAEFLKECLLMDEFPARESTPREHELSIYQTKVRLVVSAAATLTWEGDLAEAGASLILRRDLDMLNFTQVPAGTVLGWYRGEKPISEDLETEQSGAPFLRMENGQIVLTRPCIPSMLTLSERIIREDCLGYLMEPYPL